MTTRSKLCVSCLKAFHAGAIIGRFSLCRLLIPVRKLSVAPASSHHLSFKVPQNISYHNGVTRLCRKYSSSSQSKYSGKRELIPHNPDWTVNTLSISCCPDLYAPKPHGIQMEVAFVDSASQLTTKEKAAIATVVLTHGAGSSHKAMMNLARPLAAMGFRVVLPNFPGSLTRSFDGLDNKMYGHTLEENVDFLANFLHFFGLSKVDIIVGQSASCYALSSLASCIFTVDAYAYICPGTGPEPPKGMRPYIFSKALNWMWENSLLWPLAVPLLKFSLGAGGGFQGNVKNLAVALQAMCGAKLHLVPHFSSIMCQMSVPLLYCYTTQDPLCLEKEYSDHAQLNGIKSFDVYDKEANLVKQGTRDFSSRFTHGLCFQLETHLPLESQKHCDIIVKELLEMFLYNQSKIDSTVTKKPL